MNKGTWTVTVEITVYNAHSNVEAFAIADSGLRSVFAEYALCDVVKISSMDDEVCTWTYHPERHGHWDYWETGCGNTFQIDNPTDHGMEFCPYCGQRLIVSE